MNRKKIKEEDSSEWLKLLYDFIVKNHEEINRIYKLVCEDSPEKK